MPHEVPVPVRLVRFLALCCALVFALTGCGFELFQTASRLTSGNPMSALPSWPVDMKVGLGQATMPVSDLIGKNGAVPIVPLEDKTYALKPDPKAIDPIKFGDNLKAPAQAPIPIPGQSLTLPNLDQTLTGPTFNLDSLGITSLPSGIPGYTIGQILASNDPTLQNQTTPAAIPFDQAQSQATPLTGLRGAKLDSGAKLVLDITNTIGDPHEASMSMTLENLRVASNGIDLDAAWRADHPSVAISSGQITIDLDPYAVIGDVLTVTFRTKGQIPQGFRIGDLKRSQQLGITFTSHLKLKAISLPEQTMTPATQSLNIPVPAGQGIGSISSIKLASGSIQLHVANGYGVNAGLRLSLGGVLDATGNPFVSTVMLPANKTSDVTIPLDGATIQGTHIDVSLTGNTLDTEAVAPSIPASLVLPDGMAVYQAGQSLSGSVTVGALEFDSLKATFNRSVPIATSSTPVELPKEIKSFGVGFSRVAFQLQLDNKSQLPGDFALAIQAVMPDGSQLPLDYRGNHAMLPADARGLTKTSIIEINETNSNIITLLNAGAKALVFGGAVTIDSGSTPVELTRDDQLSGKVAVSVPLSLTFPEMGPGKAVPAYDIKPASPLGLDDATRKQIGAGLVMRFAIESRIDNGLHIPLSLTLLFSKQDDPYTDPAPLSKQLALGDGSSTQASLIALTADDIAFFKDAKTVGFRITSTGSHGQAVSLRSTDALSVSLIAYLKARLSATTLQGGAK